MPSKLLNSVTGGGVFRTESFIHDQTIASGQTGDLITIGTAGKLTTITYLVANATQVGIDIEVDGVALGLVGALGDFSPLAGEWFISENMDGALHAEAKLPNVTGEFITITKTAGNTVTGLNLSYVTGVVK